MNGKAITIMFEMQKAIQPSYQKKHKKECLATMGT